MRCSFCIAQTHLSQLADVLADGILAFRLLKVGGKIIFDDEVMFPDDVAVATATLERAFAGEMKIVHRRVLQCTDKLNVCCILNVLLSLRAKYRGKYRYSYCHRHQYVVEGDNALRLYFLAFNSRSS